MLKERGKERREIGERGGGEERAKTKRRKGRKKEEHERAGKLMT